MYAAQRKIVRSTEKQSINCKNSHSIRPLLLATGQMIAFPLSRKDRSWSASSMRPEISPQNIKFWTGLICARLPLSVRACVAGQGRRSRHPHGERRGVVQTQLSTLS
jgi:hypothetical protein